ncbi:1,4-dihydroxy-2-naphthoate polyprenyltransferase [Pseudalkalibacillus salsuginis]|uniref:1,4-dihydroxy-2-naphthoate polyprenyltransferase n=1 Tax=Pseudalkalibacillus salsuginis TaxID=2910972 RepID=UPI001F3357C2|nr:1,4-dihydroxy-2-naphthoate polyprenyltransferase [Pseudalkalibacillus salsuginis]MCF6408902.1 1,4-dihydroxy-2-naphthoate polyprenyltransferase [Pseudalkalibacillus salsuginis]
MEQYFTDPSNQKEISSIIESKWKIWYRQLRPHTLTASFIPVFIGAALANFYTTLNWLLLIAMLVASMLIQAATNLFNEYYDFKRGLDTSDSVGIGGGIVRDGISSKTVLNVGLAFFLLAILLGIYISATTSWWIAIIGSVSMAAGYFYTGGPYPIAYTPLGEVVAGFFMGFVIILISFYIQTGFVTTNSMLISIPISILIGAILMANNIRDLEGDKERGRKTLAILLGHRRAVQFLGGMFAFSFAWILTMIFIGQASFWLLIVLISIPKAVNAVKLFKGQREPSKMMPAMIATAQTNTVFGSALTVGLIVSYLIQY